MLGAWLPRAGQECDYAEGDLAIGRYWQLVAAIDSSLSLQASIDSKLMRSLVFCDFPQVSTPYSCESPLQGVSQGTLPGGNVSRE